VHKPLSPQGIHPPFSNYSNGVEIAPNARLVFCSGQLGVAADATIPPDIEGQTRLCFANIEAILAAAGLDLGHVFKLNAYLTTREHLRPYMEVRNALFPEPYPASTLLIVGGFSRPEFLVEVEAVAAASR
jgi:enamine deaminase RidA (YjgF/YER057c/UK114 family)